MARRWLASVLNGGLLVAVVGIFIAWAAVAKCGETRGRITAGTTTA